MAKLSKEQIEELKNLGLITSIDQATLLANTDVDELKDLKYINQVIPSAEIEEVVTHAPAVESIESVGYKWRPDMDNPVQDASYNTGDGDIQIQLLTEAPAKPTTGELYYVLANTLPEGSDKNLEWSISSGDTEGNISLVDNVIYVKLRTSTFIDVTATASNGISKTIKVSVSYSR